MPKQSRIEFQLSQLQLNSNWIGIEHALESGKWRVQLENKHALSTLLPQSTQNRGSYCWSLVLGAFYFYGYLDPILIPKFSSCFVMASTHYFQWKCGWSGVIVDSPEAQEQLHQQSRSYRCGSSMYKLEWFC